MKNGIIELEGMRFWAFHGCLESERKKGNLPIYEEKERIRGVWEKNVEVSKDREWSRNA